jgi:hypothetical protein
LGARSIPMKMPAPKPMPKPAPRFKGLHLSIALFFPIYRSLEGRRLKPEACAGRLSG